MFALDISRAFDKAWHKGLLQWFVGKSCLSDTKGVWMIRTMCVDRRFLAVKVSNCGNTGGLFSVTKSFLTASPLKVIVNCQSSEPQAIHADASQGLLLGPTLFPPLYK